MAFQTYPGVYVEEIDTFPASIAAVATAIPAFIGYVERAERDGRSVLGPEENDPLITPVRIGSLLEFEEIFGGGAAVESVEVALDATNQVKSVEVNPRFYLHTSMRGYFDNGGGDCWIAPIGRFGEARGTAPTAVHFENGLDAIAKIDEPTLLVAPDAILVDEPGDVHQKMLAQCAALKDRFAILDVKHALTATRHDTKDTDAFRDKTGTNGLRYGAGYYPFLHTSYPLNASVDAIKLTKEDNIEVELQALAPTKLRGIYTEIENINTDLSAGGTLDVVAERGILPAPADSESGKQKIQRYLESAVDLLKAYANLSNDQVLADDDATASKDADALAKSGQRMHKDRSGANGPLRPTITTLLAANNYPGGDLDPAFEADLLNGVDYSAISASEADVEALYGPAQPGFDTLPPERQEEIVAAVVTRLEGVKLSIREELTRFGNDLRARRTALDAYLAANDPTYKNVLSAIRRQGVVLPPSALVAGVYARVDARRGVWKAPANEGLSGVIAPVINLDNKDHGRLNVDAATGKSINALRAFPGRGTLVWGARTLLGNDDNWRYVNVRRLFIFIEESIEKSMSAYVFEPNTANTWVKVQTAIENFLSDIWRQGGLAGAKERDAFRVVVGLGTTMTAADVNAGKLIVDVKVAPSRPAEFIILRFSQLVQVS